MADFAYENLPRHNFGGCQFVPVCERCGAFVKIPETVLIGDAGLSPDPHTHCHRCGPTRMLSEGFV